MIIEIIYGYAGRTWNVVLTSKHRNRNVRYYESEFQAQLILTHHPKPKPYLINHVQLCREGLLIMFVYKPSCCHIMISCELSMLE